MDVPPVETIVSSVISHEDVDVKETAAEVIEEKVEEPPSPAMAQPPHTSPDLSFASEVHCLTVIYSTRYEQEDVTPSRLIKYMIHL